MSRKTTNASIARNATPAAHTIAPLFKVTPEALDYILTCAFEGGSNYWIDGGVTIDGGGEQQGDYLSSSLAFHNQNLGVHHANTQADGAELQTSILDAEKLRRGIRLFLENGGTSGILLLNPEQDCGDAGDCDQVLQLALFGSVIFG